MPRFVFSTVLVAAALCLAAGSAFAAEKPAGLDKTGKPDLKSAGQLTFGPEGVLFVGDSQGAAIFAIGVPPASGGKASAEIKVEGIDAKLAALLGTKAADLLINDMAVQPGSATVYLSAARGRGPDAEPVIVSVGPGGKLALLALENVPYAKVTLTNVPGLEDKGRGGASLRQESITDLHFVDGKLFVAGLSNEDFTSRMRAITFPFVEADKGADVGIYHGAHGRFETQSPVRTFTPFNIGGEPHILAAYTCTPLVSVPVSQLKAGAKVEGKTVAELGNMNRPLDIISYQKDGRTYLLMANNNRGVMKINTETIAQQEGIKDPVRGGGKAGLPYDTITELKGKRISVPEPSVTCSMRLGTCTLAVCHTPRGTTTAPLPRKGSVVRPSGCSSRRSAEPDSR
jgi:hypothetical protein